MDGVWVGNGWLGEANWRKSPTQLAYQMASPKYDKAPP